MISAFISPEAFLRIVIQCRSAFWQVRTKYTSVAGMKNLSDQDIHDCISIALSITLKRNSVKPLDGAKHAEEYFFKTLWTNVSETYNKNVKHGVASVEFNEQIGQEDVVTDIDASDLTTMAIVNEVSNFILAELKKVEGYDISKRDRMALNKMKNSKDEIVKKFSRETIEFMKKGFPCDKRIIYIRSYQSEDDLIQNSALQCMNEININEQVANLANYATCKAYNKKYLETKTLYGLTELVLEGNSIASIAEEKGRLVDPIRQKIREIKSAATEKLAS